MKKLLFFILLLFIIKDIYAQYSIAGTKGRIYVEPNVLINPFSDNVVDEYYNIDINQDGNNDIKIHFNHDSSLGMGSAYIDLYSLDSSTSFSYWKTDTFHIDSCGGYTSIDNILKKNSYGDTIKKGIYINSGGLSFEFSSMVCYYSFGDNSWIDTNDQYIGIRFETSTDTLYGWIRVVVSDYQAMLIKDFSLGAPYSIINDSNINESINVMPNPATTNVTIISKGMNNSTISIYNIQGQIIKQITSNKTTTNIVVSALAKGMYFVKVQTEKGVAVKKFIKE